MNPAIDSAPGRSTQIQLSHMHRNTCLLLGFRRLMRYQKGTAQVPHATVPRCQASQSSTYSQLCQCMYPSQQPNQNPFAERGRKLSQQVSPMSGSMPQYSKLHMRIPILTNAASSRLAIVTTDTERTESDSEDDMTQSTSTMPSLSDAASIDEAVTGYLQDDAASDTVMHRSSSEAREQVRAALSSACVDSVLRQGATSADTAVLSFATTMCTALQVQTV